MLILTQSARRGWIYLVIWSESAFAALMRKPQPLNPTAGISQPDVIRATFRDFMSYQLDEPNGDGWLLYR